MSRIRSAWLALKGIQEIRTEQRIVIGDAMKTTVYSVWVENKDGARIEQWDGSIVFISGETRYYQTCEQAHAANPGKSVYAVEAITVNGHLFVGDLKSVTVQPKPKVAKGRK